MKKWITAFLVLILVLSIGQSAHAQEELELGVYLGDESSVTQRVDVPVTLNQTQTLRDQAIAAVRSLRGRMYDENVPFNGKPLQEAVKTAGLTRDEYVNGLSWDTDMERIAVIRAIEVMLMPSLQHERLTDNTIWTATIGEKKPGNENIVAGTISVSNAINKMWGDDEKQALLDANGVFNAQNGHLYNLIHPEFKSTGLAFLTGIEGKRDIGLMVSARTASTSKESLGLVGEYIVEILVNSADLGKEVKETLEKQEIPFETETTENPNLAYGDEKIIREGIPGEKLVERRGNLYNGYLVNVSIVETVLRQPTSKLVDTGINKEMVPTQVTGYTTSDVFFRPSKGSSKSLGIIPEGTALRGVYDGYWVKVTYEGQSGYIAKALFSEEEQQEEDKVPMSGVLSADIYVRPSKGSSEKYGILSKGTKVSGLVDGAWLEIEYNGVTGYIALAFVEKEVEPVVQTRTGYLKSSLYFRPSKGSSTNLGIIPKGTKVTGTVDGNWLRTTYNGKTGYIAASFLSATPVETQSEGETLAGTLTSDLFFRPEKGSSESLGIIPEGTKVSGTVDGAWLKITYDGESGYIAKSFVKESTFTGTTTSSLFVRPAKNSGESLGILAKGSSVTGVVEGAWLRINYGGKTAYIAKAFVE